MMKRFQEGLILGFFESSTSTTVWLVLPLDPNSGFTDRVSNVDGRLPKLPVSAHCCFCLLVFGESATLSSSFGGTDILRDVLV